MATFKDLGISQWLINSLKATGINEPSNIQRRALPAIFSLKSDGRTRKDVFACSRTGSGKTLAFVLPILEMLVRDPRPYFALILAPTRELAYQINEMIKVLTGAAKNGGAFVIKSLLVIGGGKYGDGLNPEEAQGLWFGKPNIVVATPGRFLDQVTNKNQLEFCGSMRTFSFDMLVMDEADQLISPSFCEQITGILDWLDANDVKYLDGGTPFRQKKRQTLVFSATLTSALEELKEIVTKKDPENQPVIINLLPSIERIKRELSTNPYLDQRYILCPEAVKYAYLVECLLDLKFKQLIIFCGTRKEARLIHRTILNLGFGGKDFAFDPVLLNSGMQQHLRFAALDRFKAMKSRILVTTDLANRGLDIPQVDLVINVSCPKAAITYVHRVGRTCRIPDMEEEKEEEEEEEQKEEQKEEEQKKDGEGNGSTKSGYVSSKNSVGRDGFKGKAITLITQYDIKLIQSIEQFIGLKLEKEDQLDEDNITSILKQVVVALKEAEISLETEDRSTDSKAKSNKRMKPVKMSERGRSKKAARGNKRTNFKKKQT